MRDRNDLTRSVTRLAGRLASFGALCDRDDPDRAWSFSLSTALIDALREQDRLYPATPDDTRSEAEPRARAGLRTSLS